MRPAPSHSARGSRLLPWTRTMITVHERGGGAQRARCGQEQGKPSFSVNPAMITSARAQRLLREIPPDRVLLETDGPFTRHHGRPSRPSDLPALLPRLAALWSLDEDGARRRLNTNQAVFFPPPTPS
ncbi:TatD family hydrolase [Streptomyces griseoincarnatus]|uniref:TatD family hydrolase n=2 Tax=Streptomyces canus TaxID=58343 RepID=UPI003482B8D3